MTRRQEYFEAKMKCLIREQSEKVHIIKNLYMVAGDKLQLVACKVEEPDVVVEVV